MEKNPTPARVEQFSKFYQRIENDLLKHRVIVNNTFTKQWAKGEMTLQEMRAFLVQFSVFSNLFIIAQLQKVMNADSLEAMHASKEILVNELGVIFRPHKGREKKVEQNLEFDEASDLELLSSEGTVEGGTFRFSAAHFEWLLKMAHVVGLEFQDIGKRKHGIPSTLFFCDELYRLYGNSDYEIGQAASFSVENWAAAGFWKHLITGLQIFKQKHSPKLPLGFFTYHDRLEEQHAAHTKEELKDYYLKTPSMNEDQFIRYGKEMLDAVAVFWDGLEEQRKTIRN